MRTAIHVLCLPSCIGLWSPGATAQRLVGFASGPPQPAQALRQAWARVPEADRARIEAHLAGLWLSSTGQVRLVAVYDGEAAGSLLQFQQVDLHGWRLFWSVLVDVHTLQARSLYHVEHPDQAA